MPQTKITLRRTTSSDSGFISQHNMNMNWTLRNTKEGLQRLQEWAVRNNRSGVGWGGSECLSGTERERERTPHEAVSFFLKRRNTRKQ